MFQHGHPLQTHHGAAAITQVHGRVQILIQDLALMAVVVEILAAAEAAVIGKISIFIIFTIG